MVAFYGEKPSALAQIVTTCQRLLRAKLGGVFEAYDLHQVHATIVGLEAVPDRPTLENLNFQKHRNRTVEMDVKGFRNFLLGGSHLPFAVQVAGFADRDYPFTSRSSRPYVRSFSLQGDKAVVMGWPIRRGLTEEPLQNSAEIVEQPGLYLSTLDQLRASAQTYGILHDYHRTPEDVDNDFYFRVGLLKGAVDVHARAEAESAVRQLLACHPPVVLDVNGSVLSLVSYSDSRMPRASSQARPLTEETSLATLYGDKDAEITK